MLQFPSVFSLDTFQPVLLSGVQFGGAESTQCPTAPDPSSLLSLQIGTTESSFDLAGFPLHS